MAALIAESVVELPASVDDVVELDYDARHRRRIVMRTQAGREFLLDLPKATALAHGNGLVLSDGTVVAVRARAERVVDVRAENAEQLARLAWHLGNRHLPSEIRSDSIRIRYDHVIVDMLKGLGAETQVLEAPFHPERGAYAHGH